MLNIMSTGINSVYTTDLLKAMKVRLSLIMTILCQLNSAKRWENIHRISIEKIYIMSSWRSMCFSNITRAGLILPINFSSNSKVLVIWINFAISTTEMSCSLHSCNLSQDPTRSIVSHFLEILHISLIYLCHMITQVISLLILLEFFLHIPVSNIVSWTLLWLHVWTWKITH